MATAFGSAMIDSIDGQIQSFTMTKKNGPSMVMSCRDFLNLRPDEVELLDSLNIPSDGKVLDWGCGVGRHLSHLRGRNQFVHCFGVDICNLMLDRCRETIADPATFSTNLVNDDDKRFDLILLMGNGLGVLGGEQDAINGLTHFVQLLNPGGRIVIETGNPFGPGYFADDFTISYGDRNDTFTWGYADKPWLESVMNNFGCHVEFRPSNALGNFFFFAIAQLSI